MRLSSLNYIRSSSAGFALPAALMTLLLFAGTVAILSNLTIHNFNGVELERTQEDTYYAAEGAVSKQISEMSIYSSLWSQRTNLSTEPDGYSQFSPQSFMSSNGIPSCTGVGCHREMYPTGGGLIKNLGPVNESGDQVDGSYSITSQYNPQDPQEADVTLANTKAWTQIERLDETTPGPSSVGGSLSNGVAEGGNARTVRYRVTGMSVKKRKGKEGYSTVVTVVEMPLG